MLIFLTTKLYVLALNVSLKKKPNLKKIFLNCRISNLRDQIINIFYFDHFTNNEEPKQNY